MNNTWNNLKTPTDKPSLLLTFNINFTLITDYAQIQRISKKKIIIYHFNWTILNINKNIYNMWLLKIVVFTNYVKFKSFIN